MSTPGNVEVDVQQNPDGTLGTAVFDSDRLYRYNLLRVWDRDLPMTCFVMLNPSKADAFILDPTVTRCLGFAKDWGSGSLLVLNVFALRSTDPKALYGHPDPVGPENDRLIMEALEQWQPAQVVAAWGVHAATLDRTGARRPRGASPWRSRAEEVGAMLGDRLLALRVTKDGHPGHPLYLPGDARPQPYVPSGRP